MGRFNLLDEPWISVLVDETGEKKEVSMLEFFQNAGKYRSFAGEMKTQDFAVMRFLLAVIQTVFSRLDFHGNALPGVYLDNKWLQVEPVGTDDTDDYCIAVSECWKELYLGKDFPKVISDYLEKWRDRFYFFDNMHPFYQVTEEEMNGIMSKIPKKNQPTTIYGKNLNRTISESENKTALFSPIADIGIGKRSSKDVLSPAELTRWVLTFQGYSGLADKVALTPKGQRSSKGWLFDLGGIFLEGRNTLETLVLNYLPESPKNDDAFIGRVQNPCWEASGSKVVDRLCVKQEIDNLAEIYTNWSRAIYIDPDSDMAEPVQISVVKLPEIDHTENSLEPMTLWRWNENGPNQNHYTPKKHVAEQALWRSFGIIAMDSSTSEEQKYHRPGIFSQYQRLKNAVGSRWTDLVGVSMVDDGNATSWLPVDEIFDSFQINDVVITDSDPDGWIIRINDAVETTKEVVSGIFRSYLKGICEIRNLKTTNPVDPIARGFIDDETAKVYAEIDFIFKDWLASLTPKDSKEDKIKLWNAQLRKIILKHGEELFENSTERDLTGIETDTGIENIATKYWQFIYRINKKLGKGVTN